MHIGTLVNSDLYHPFSAHDFERAFTTQLKDQTDTYSHLSAKVSVSSKTLVAVIAGQTAAARTADPWCQS
jgi:hypothetical protein